MFDFVVQKDEVMDGCTAAATVAYMNTEASYIYPITPSTLASETFENLCTAGRKNIFDQVNLVRQLQSEAGAAGSVHGSLSVGTLTTTFTASQGLLLMIPVMYKVSGELMPCVFHVPARSVASQALSIFGDHTDVMACRGTGWALFSSSSVQESVDFAMIAHMATVEARVPFLHFFDGFRTSHELNKVKCITLETCKHLTNYEKIQEFRDCAMHPTNPYIRGTAQQPEVYMQNVELSNSYYTCLDYTVEDCMKKFGDVTGRYYKPFDYFGNPEATDVIVIIGAGGQVVREVLEYLEVHEPGAHKKGLIICRLFRPWSTRCLIDVIPLCTERIAVLDRTKEFGAMGEPLFVDVCAAVQQANRTGLKIIGGRYGLGSRDFLPPAVLAVYRNLASATTKHPFTVGIVDDVTHLSLDYNLSDINSVPPNTTECLFYGMGSDGTVGANKNVIKIIGMNTDMFAQGYFAYSAYKAGGLTISHLRFGPHEIKSSYLIQRASYIAVHRSEYIFELDVGAKLGKDGIFVLNCEWSAEEVADHLPVQLKRQIATTGSKFYVIDANKIAVEVGMGRRINSILMTTFFFVSGVLPFEQAIKLFKDAIVKSYSKKGPAVVAANHAAVDAACAGTHEVHYDAAAWKLGGTSCLEDAYSRAAVDSKHYGAAEMKNRGNTTNDEVLSRFENVIIPATKMMDDSLPVSAFQGLAGGFLPSATTQFEKRAIALNIPIVDMDKCTQCNYCAFVCPHAAIRPFLLDDDEKEAGPVSFDSRKSKGMSELGGLHYRIQVAPLDCTGCELCAIACPDDALTMTPLPLRRDVESVNWKFATTLPERSDLIPGAARTSLKGSQFYKPLLEFSGACEGCGETPYVKLLTQLFGERLIIANATGCSSIWGASYPSAPYTTNDKGLGPAWGNSLFEDAAEYGYGMTVSMVDRRRRMHDFVGTAVADDEFRSIAGEEITDLLDRWMSCWEDNPAESSEIYDLLVVLVPSQVDKHSYMKVLNDDLKLLVKPSFWIVGGDGWACDIGFGGLDHVLQSGIDINVLVLDTEVYSNTGGQKSKATVMGAQHKFAQTGHTRNKKDLTTMMLDYGEIYIASCASSANMAQTVRAFHEAESFRGPSLITAYSPCIEHNYIKPFSSQILHCKLAVDSGYWLLFRYNPDLKNVGELPMQMDCKKLKVPVSELVQRENRFKSLSRVNPVLASSLTEDLEKWIKRRFDRMMFLASYGEAGELANQAEEGDIVNVLYGSETGNAEEVAARLSRNLKTRELNVKCQSFAEVELDDIKSMKQVIIFVSTAGQGEIPGAAIPAHEELKACTDTGALSGVQYAVFGLGDSTYLYFNEAAKLYDCAFEKLGAIRMLETGAGDDQHEEKYETVLGEWWPGCVEAFGFPEPKNVKDTPDDAIFEVKDVAPGKYNKCIHYGCKEINLVKNERMTPSEYDVEVMHMEFDLLKTGMKYALGDSLAVWPENDPVEVRRVCEYFGYNPDQWISVSRAGKETSAKHECLFKKPISVEQLFVECIDILGKPNRGFYEMLYKHVTDPEEKARAKTLLSAENKSEMSKWSDAWGKSLTYFTAMQMFPSCKPSLAQMIDLISLTKPRYYSIASSQKYVGPTNLHLCVGVVDWTDSDGVRHIGECTGMFSRYGEVMRSTAGPKSVCASIKATAFHLPDTEEKPVIVAGMGTGLAPFRAFIQHKAWLRREGKPCGPLTVYFGCRYKAKDYLYGEEMEKYLEDGVITELRCAFSRDTKEKFYIQHHIDRDTDLFYTRFHQEGGYFYLCGSAAQVPIDMRKSITAVMIKHENMTAEEAKEYIDDMIVKGRYNVEAW
eukprot:GHVH01013595.1.p1 GENE.GHVH01013595.1~~GHVH01013595.1.p1  ORF type:complete len:1813 (+),score=257.55 GHVH01013595.1:123-5561(+)